MVRFIAFPLFFLHFRCAFSCPLLFHQTVELARAVGGRRTRGAVVTRRDVVASALQQGGDGGNGPKDRQGGDADDGEAHVS